MGCFHKVTENIGWLIPKDLLYYCCFYSYRIAAVDLFSLIRFTSLAFLFPASKDLKDWNFTANLTALKYFSSSESQGPDQDFLPSHSWSTPGYCSVSGSPDLRVVADLSWRTSFLSSLGGTATLLAFLPEKPAFLVEAEFFSPFNKKYVVYYRWRDLSNFNLALFGNLWSYFYCIHQTLFTTKSSTIQFGNKAKMALKWRINL